MKLAVTELWCDGGVVKKNPSPFAGTWAWIALDGDGERVKGDSGIVTPAYLNLPTVSNNVTELLATVKALQWVACGWTGTLFTDSLVTKRRLTDGQSFNGVPQWLRVQALELRRSRRFEVVLVGGHPTQKELSQGFRPWVHRCPDGGVFLSGSAGRIPVGPWNVWCDQRCKQEAKRFMKTTNGNDAVVDRQ